MEARLDPFRHTDRQWGMTNEVQVSIRLAADVPERAEELARRLAKRAEFRAFRMTRAAVLRLALLEGLELLEEKYPDEEGGD